MARGSAKSDAFDVKAATAAYRKQEASGEAFSRKNSIYVNTKDMPEAMNIVVKATVSREVALRVKDEMIRDHNKLKQVFLSNSVNRKDGTSSTFSPIGTPARLKLKKDVEELARTIRRLRGALTPELDGSTAKTVEVPFTYAQRDKWENRSKKGSSKSDFGGIVAPREPNPYENQGIGGRNAELRAIRRSLGKPDDDGIEYRVPRGIMEQRTPTYSPDELAEAKRIQKGGIYRRMEGPGAAEERAKRIKATEDAQKRERAMKELSEYTPYKAPKKRK
jgi:hypothetical protein